MIEDLFENDFLAVTHMIKLDSIKDPIRLLVSMHNMTPHNQGIVLRLIWAFRDMELNLNFQVTTVTNSFLDPQIEMPKT